MTFFLSKVLPIGEILTLSKNKVWHLLKIFVKYYFNKSKQSWNLNSKSIKTYSMRTLKKNKFYFLRSNITLFQIGFSLLRQKKKTVGRLCMMYWLWYFEKLMFDKYLLSMELISINSKICFKLSVHRLGPIRRVLQFMHTYEILMRNDWM